MVIESNVTVHFRSISTCSLMLPQYEGWLWEGQRPHQVLKALAIGVQEALRVGCDCCQLRLPFHSPTGQRAPGHFMLCRSGSIHHSRVCEMYVLKRTQFTPHLRVSLSPPPYKKGVTRVLKLIGTVGDLCGASLWSRCRRMWASLTCDEVYWLQPSRLTALRRLVQPLLDPV